MISQIPTPQRTNNNKVQGEFYPLQKDELIALRQSKLINNAAFVHLALRYENPFCDRPVEVNPKEFALSWNIPESSIYKAVAQLKKLGLILLKSGKLLIEWISKSGQTLSEPVPIISSETELTELSDPAKNYQIRQKIIRSENKLSDPAKNSQIRQNRSPEPLPKLDSVLSQTIQTNKTVHTLSDCDTHIDYWSIAEKEENNQLEQYISSLDQEPKTNVLLNPPSASFNSHNLKVEKNVPAGSIIVRDQETDHEQQDINHSSFITRNSIWQWLPEGAWNVNGKLDSAFQEWLAKKWVVKYQDCDIYESKANVLAYFRNDPAKLPIRWKQYQEEYLAKVQNIKNRLDNGCTISPEQQQETIALLGALRPLDPEQSVSFEGSSQQGVGSSEEIIIRQLPQVKEGKREEGVGNSEQVGSGEQGVGSSENNQLFDSHNSELTSTAHCPLPTPSVTDAEGKKYKTYTKESAEEIPVNENFQNRLAQWLKSMGGGHYA